MQEGPGSGDEKYERYYGVIEVHEFIPIASGRVAVGPVEVFDLVVRGALLVLILRQRYLVVFRFTYAF